MSLGMTRQVTFTLSYFKAIAKAVEENRYSDLYNVQEDKNLISIYFAEDLNYGLSCFNYPKWMGEYPRVSAPWSDLEVKELLHGYQEEHLTINQLCKKHGRAKGGILSRLGKYIPDIEERYGRQVRILRLEKELLSLEAQMKFIKEQIKDLQ